MKELRFNSNKQKCVTDSVNSIRGILDVNEATVKTTTTTNDIDEVKIVYPGFKSIKNITDDTIIVYVCFLPEVTVDEDWQKLHLLPGYNWETFNYISSTKPSFVEAVEYVAPVDAVEEVLDEDGETVLVEAVDAVEEVLAVPAYWKNCTRPEIDTLEIGY